VTLLGPVKSILQNPPPSIRRYPSVSSFPPLPGADRSQSLGTAEVVATKPRNL